ncbi:MAG: hypothetical protein QME88_03695 [Actinomycetota bacterium]|nr:hypothetical protein [Actinomycetota bacterium]
MLMAQRDAEGDLIYQKNILVQYPAHVFDLSMPEAVRWCQGKLRALLELEASVINPYPLCSLRVGLSPGLYGFTF